MKAPRLYVNHPNLFLGKVVCMSGHLGIGVIGYTVGTHTPRGLIFTTVFFLIGLAMLVGLFRETSRLVRTAEIVGFSWNMAFLILFFAASLLGRVSNGQVTLGLAYTVILLWAIWTAIHLLLLREPDFQDGRHEQ